ncbi:MAG TPA: PKD domain-containing protein, partial [Blastocatellia bacterium]|nr:PKD domain-containing protein [Blastocatellia bacterium]
HYYPQGGELGNDTSQATVLLRNRSTRSLWDPNYVDESWINDKVMLIPRLKNWVNTYYPGTLTAVTEYNWGAESDINGATAQADVLGIFGREGLDLATRWTTPDATTPAYNSIKMYRNYDGQKSTFGDVSVQDAVPSPDDLSSFAAVRSTDGALTVMIINKALSGNTPVTVNLANFTANGPAQVWQLTAANAITRLADANLSGNSLGLTLPQQSITLVIVPASSSQDEPPVAVLRAAPQTGTAPLAVTFDGSGSSDADGQITTYEWNFGDGADSKGTPSSLSHTYSNPGSYTATLTVTDSTGLTASTTVSISASSAAPGAPSRLTAGAKSRTVTLHWTNNSTSQAGVYVERAPKSTGVFARIGQVGPGVATFSESVAKGNYRYRVQAFSSGGTVSTYSNTVTIKVK